MGRLPMSRRQGGGETAREGGGEGVEERWKVQERMHSQGVRESRRGGRVWWKREERWRFIRGELERKKKGGCSAVEGGEGGEGLSRVRRERGKEIDMEEGKKYGSIRKARDTETRRVLYNFSFFVCVVFMPICLSVYLALHMTAALNQSLRLRKVQLLPSPGTTFSFFLSGYIW